MASNTIPHTNNTQWASNGSLKTEYRPTNGIGIIRWRLPTHSELTEITKKKIKEDVVEKLYQRLVKDFLARNFIDLDLFVLPESSVWLSGIDNIDVYALPKGRSKVRIDDIDGEKILTCQWHLPSHLVEYFNIHQNDSDLFDRHWDRQQIIELIIDYIKL